MNSGAWERWTKLRAQIFHMSTALVGLGFMLAITRLWVPEVSASGAVMLVSGFWGFTVHNLLGELVRLQAALDMKRIAMGHTTRTVGQVVHLNAGDSLTISVIAGGPVAEYTAHTSCTLERTA